MDVTIKYVHCTYGYSQKHWERRLSCATVAILLGDSVDGTAWKNNAHTDALYFMKLPFNPPVELGFQPTCHYVQTYRLCQPSKYSPECMIYKMDQLYRIQINRTIAYSTRKCACVSCYSARTVATHVRYVEARPVNFASANFSKSVRSSILSNKITVGSMNSSLTLSRTFFIDS